MSDDAERPDGALSDGAEPDAAEPAAAEPAAVPEAAVPDAAELDAAEPAAVPDAAARDSAKPSKADRLIAKAERLREQEAQRAAAAAQRAAMPAGARRTGVSPGWRAAAVVVGVVAVLVAALSVVLFVAWRHEKDDRSELAHARSASLAAAKSYAVSFGSYDYRHLDADFAKTSTMMTPSFAKNYEKTSAALAQTFTAYKTRVTASVPAAAVISATPNKAVVLVLLDQVITSSQSTTPKINRNRLEITLTHASGRWLVAQTDAT